MDLSDFEKGYLLQAGSRMDKTNWVHDSKTRKSLIKKGLSVALDGKNIELTVFGDKVAKYLFSC